MHSPLMKALRFQLWLVIHTLPRWQIRLWQQLRLRRLKKHAFKHNPFLRARWEVCGVDTPEVAAHASLPQLPLIRKKDFLNVPFEERVSGGLPTTHYDNIGFTGGSTAEPIKFIRATYGTGGLDEEQQYLEARQWRFLLWDGITVNELLSEVKTVEFRESPNANPNRLQVPIEDFRADPESFLKKIGEFAPTALGGYSTFLLEFAETLQKSSLAGTVRVPWVVIGGQPLNKEDILYIEKVLRCKLLNRYSFEEFRSVAVECRERNGFHIHSESFVFEVVGERGEKVATGKTGRLLITDLYNYAMPFIRYDTGDYGYVEESPCPCGLRTPRVFLQPRPEFILSVGTKKISRADINNVLGKYADIITHYEVGIPSKDTVRIRVETRAQAENIGPVLESAQRELALLFDGTGVSLLFDVS